MAAKSRGAFVISRVFDAPRERVWKAWTEPERLRQWWGPKGFTVFSCKVDLRPGGVFHYGMRASDGSDMWGKVHPSGDRRAGAARLHRFLLG